MECLLTQIKKLPISGKISVAGSGISVAQLINRADETRLQYPQLYQGNLALSYIDLVEFVSALLAFDGWCRAIFLCPSNVAPPLDDTIAWPVDDNETRKSLDISQQAQHASDVVATTWFLATSGTTGEPKWVAHTFGSLSASLKHSHKLQNLTWALLYQPFRFAGLQVVLQALLSGADIIDVADHDPLDLVVTCKQADVTAISATPSLWRQLLMTGQLAELGLSHLTLGGEIADQSVLDKLKILYPDARLRHIYASTEAGVGLVVSDGLAGFPATWLDDENLEVPLKVSANQHLLVKPSFNLCPSLQAQTDAQGYLDTQDKVEIENHRVLFIGRASGTINVGGNKVHPEKIEQVLLQNTEISQAKVYAKKSALMGELVVADIVISNGAPEHHVKQQLVKTCKNKLQRFEIPTKINVVAHIAHDPSGKVNRK